jgi:thiamine kinase-like enzyme
VRSEARALGSTLRAVPALASGALRFTDLPGGITNENVLVEVEGSVERYVARLPGRETHLLGIDREAEVAATRAAASTGVGPEVVAYLPEHAILVTRFIAGRALEPEHLADPGIAERVGRALRTIHDGPAFPGTFDPLATATTYLDLARQRGVAPTPLQREARRVAERLATSGALAVYEPAPCHNDLLAANLIDDGSAIRIVDWEYAAMGDPRFDLGNLAANNELDGVALRALAEAHDGRPADARRLAELTLMRVVSDFREAAWGVIQQAISTIDSDFAAYADRHFERMLAVASTPAFDDAIALTTPGSA